MKNLTIYDSMIPAARVANSLFNGFDPFDAFNSLIDDGFSSPESVRSPRVDIKEEANRYLIEAELPGLSEKDVKLEVKDGVLVLSAQKDENKEEKDETKWLRQERRAFSFSRRFGLPEEADVENIKASFKDGLLSIELPKKPEAAPRLIPVKAA